MRLGRGGLTVGSVLILVGVGLMAVPGCGSNSKAASKTVYFSPDEISQKKAELQDAMKGGAYGSAGKRANLAP